MSTGKRFEDRIKDWHKDLPCMTFKFPDYSCAGIMKRVWCDRITVTNGRVIFFEMKHTSSDTVLKKNAFRSHQLPTLLELERRGAITRIMIENGRGIVYMLSPNKFVNLLGERKQLHLVELNEYIISRDKFRKWILSNVLQ